ncbi:hypothetical protein D0868_10726 [Hortaea werneckii]|uniref:Uncharacterized protein n=1 Tax=Hortaea werneckii TaxID=91943 RepID=A0A3M6Y2Q7_HORWE|nr:hypothetical protein D0868_10726 [Hortaea werneckii]
MLHHSGRLSTIAKTLGMPESDSSRIIALGNGVWLDEIRNEGAAPIKDVPGGSVTFCMQCSNP